MEIIIRGTKVITGDGHTVLEKAHVLIDRGRIIDVLQGEIGDQIPNDAGCVIDGAGYYTIPGIINAHAHGCSTGPLFPCGASALSYEKARRNAERMLSQGVTTLINLCGFVLPSEIEPVAETVPINLSLGTSHMPVSLKSALSVDGRGLSERHRAMNAMEMIENGAPVIGEIGSGASLGGGVADYKYIPEAIRKAAGIEIDRGHAHRLKTAVLGRNMNIENYDPGAVAQILRELHIDTRLSPDDAREIVETVVYKPINISLESFGEAFEMSRSTGIPAVFHNSLVSAEHLLRLAARYEGTRARIVAGHSNHPSFTPEEAVHYAGKLKAHGVVIDVSSLDGIITRRLGDSGSLEALAAEGLIDTISTDFGGGHWDGILEAIHLLVQKKLISPAKGVAMATGNAARVVPVAAHHRGLVEKGMIADLVLTDEKNMGRVETVITGGRIAVRGGWLQKARS